MLEERSAQLTHALAEWGSFAEYMREEHGIAMDCLNEAYADEHRLYYMRTAQWKSLLPDAIVGEACPWYSFDVGTVTIDELKTAAHGPFSCTVLTPGPVHAIAGWFDVVFDGSPASPAETVVVLSTSPAVGYTHWGQQVFLLSGEVLAERGDVLQGQGSLIRQEKNQRTLYMDIVYSLRRRLALGVGELDRKIRYAID